MWIAFQDNSTNRRAPRPSVNGTFLQSKGKTPNYKLNFINCGIDMTDGAGPLARTLDFLNECLDFSLKFAYGQLLICSLLQPVIVWFDNYF